MVATKYCTLAELTVSAYRELVTIMPDIQNALKKGIYEYNDRQLRFIKRSIQTVPFFANIEEECLYNVVFSLKTQKFHENHIFQKPGDGATSLYFL